MFKYICIKKLYERVFKYICKKKLIWANVCGVFWQYVFLWLKVVRRRLEIMVVLGGVLWGLGCLWGSSVNDTWGDRASLSLQIKRMICWKVNCPGSVHKNYSRPTLPPSFCVDPEMEDLLKNQMEKKGSIRRTGGVKKRRIVGPVATVASSRAVSARDEGMRSAIHNLHVQYLHSTSSRTP